VPVVVAPQPPEAAAVIARVAAERAAPLVVATERTRLVSQGDPAGPLALTGRQAVSLCLPPGLRANGRVTEERLTLPLLGAHQLMNAATAVTLAETLAGRGVPIVASAVVAGLERVSWPGRLEILATAPLVVADAAHTPESAARLRAALADHFPGRPTTIVLAISNDKDIDGIAAALVPAAARLLVTSHARARATPVDDLAAAIQRAGGRAEIMPDVATALNAALLGADATTDLICVTGSLVTVGEARTALGRPAA
jgi:dihydrofolate synthase/folylpolyglutamate synthase